MWVGRFSFKRDALYAAAVVDDELQDVGEVAAAECERSCLVVFAGVPLQEVATVS